MTKKLKYTLLILGALFITIALVIGVKYLLAGKEGLDTDGGLKKPENVSLRLKWIDQAQFAGFYTAKEKSFYAEEGLSVDIYPGGPDISPVQMVVTGVNDFGITGSDQILLAREKGVPIVALAVIYKQSPVAIGSLKEKNIKTPQDLEGKKVGVVYGRDEEIIYRALLAKTGVDIKKIEEVPVIAGISQITTGQFDAQVLYEINEPILLAQKGFEVNLIKPRDYGVNFYADTLFTTEKMIRERPETVRAFVQASIMGWKESLANPKEAIETVMRVNKGLDKEHQSKFFELSIPLIDTGEKIGYSDKSIWGSIQEILIDQKIMKTRVDIDKVFTNDFID